MVATPRSRGREEMNTLRESAEAGPSLLGKNAVAGLAEGKENVGESEQVDMFIAPTNPRLSSAPPADRDVDNVRVPASQIDNVPEVEGKGKPIAAREELKKVIRRAQHMRKWSRSRRFNPKFRGNEFPLKSWMSIV